MKAKCPDCGKPCKNEHGLKIHQLRCQPPVLKPVVLNPIKVMPLSESIRRVMDLAEDVGGLQELRKACDALLVEELV